MNIQNLGMINYKASSKILFGESEDGSYSPSLAVSNGDERIEGENAIKQLFSEYSSNSREKEFLRRYRDNESFQRFIAGKKFDLSKPEDLNTVKELISNAVTLEGIFKREYKVKDIY